MRSLIGICSIIKIESHRLASKTFNKKAVFLMILPLTSRANPKYEHKLSPTL